MVRYQESKSYRQYGEKWREKENKRESLVQRSFEIHLGRLL